MSLTQLHQTRNLLTKGLPTKKIPKSFLWCGHLARKLSRTGRIPIPQNWGIYFLVIHKGLFTNLFTVAFTAILLTNIGINQAQASCAAPYSNLDFEQQPSSYWQIEGRGGFDVKKGYSFKGQNNAWMRNVSGWNGIRQQVRLKPNTNYILEAYVRTSANVTDGYFGVRDSQQKVWSELKFGSLPQYTKLTLQFRTGNASAYNIFTGLWALGQDSWVQVDSFSLKGPSPECFDQQ